MITPFLLVMDQQLAEEQRFAINKCAEINKQWFPDSVIQVVVYRLEAYNGTKPYRFALFDNEQNMNLVDKLFPSTADGHTYFMMAEALKDTFRTGVEIGKIEAVKMQLEALTSLLGVSKRFTIK